MQGESVQNRLQAILAQSYDNPLAALAEVRMYQTRGLLHERQYVAACRKLVGEDEGAKLATGSRLEKDVVIRKWLPQPK
jgi:hypothetical protein